VSDTPERSPALLAPAPKRGTGVRRLNKVPIMIVIGGAMLVVAAIGYTYRDRMMQSAANAQQAASHKPEPGNGAAVLDGAPGGGEVAPASDRTLIPAKSPGTSSQPSQTPLAVPSDNSGADSGQAQGEDDATKARREAWQTYYAQLAQLQKDRLTAATSAMTADTGLSSSTSGQVVASNTGGSGVASGPAQVPGGVVPEMGVGPFGVAVGTYPGGFGLPARADASVQREKQACLDQPGDVTGSSDDLRAALRDPSSPFLVMAGTAIPAVMIGGINSDMPGMVIGQVSQNVYDTATGRYLLIPQGARLVGSCDSQRAGLTQAELAQQAGLAQPAIP
jgi:type IV secretion system protein TrbI